MNNIKILAIRHGEVLLYPVESMPSTKKEKSTNYIVGHSETGHHHTLKATKAFETTIDKDKLYVRLFAPAKLVHQKSVNRHNDLTVPAGIYKVIHKKEYSPFTKLMERVWD